MSPFYAPRVTRPEGREREETIPLSCSCGDKIIEAFGRPVLMGFPPFEEVTHDSITSIFMSIIFVT